MNNLLTNSIRRQATRTDALALYKRFVYLADDWPQGREVYLARLKKAFLKNQDAGKNQAEKLITHGSFVEKEIIALYQLKKYRALKNRYMGDDPSKFGQAATLLNEYMDDGKTGSTDSIISKT